MLKVTHKVAAVVLGLMLGTGLTAARAAEIVTFGSLTDPAYDAVFWAIENGKVTSPDVTVKIEKLTSIPQLMQAVATQQFNLIVNGVLSVPQVKESGVPVRIMGTLLRYNTNGHSADIWVLKDSPYKTVADLKGKKIAVVAVEAQNIVSIRTALSEKHGMNAASVGGDFQFVELPPSQFEAAIQAGRVDAVTFSNVPSYTLTKGGAYRSVMHGSKDLADLYGGAMVSLLITGYDPDIAKRPAAYVAAAKLLKASSQYASQHPDEVFAAVAPKYKMTKEDVQTYFTTYAEMPLALGKEDKQVIMKAWKSGEKLGALKNVPATVDELMWPEALME